MPCIAAPFRKLWAAHRPRIAPAGPRVDHTSCGIALHTLVASVGSASAGRVSSQNR
jgi:hypothetical protein